MEADGMAIPDKIKAHKPDINQYGATEIRCIKNHFYVYEISSKWDAQKHRPKKLPENVLERLRKKTDLSQTQTISECMKP